MLLAGVMHKTEPVIIKWKNIQYFRHLQCTKHTQMRPILFRQGRFTFKFSQSATRFGAIRQKLSFYFKG